MEQAGFAAADKDHEVTSPNRTPVIGAGVFMLFGNGCARADKAVDLFRDGPRQHDGVVIFRRQVDRCRPVGVVRFLRSGNQRPKINAAWHGGFEGQMVRGLTDAAG